MRTLVTLISLSLATAAAAQEEGNTTAALGEIQESKRDVADAKKDLQKIQAATSKWNKAAAGSDWEKAKKADAAIFGWLKSEQIETRGELREAREELQGSKREVGLAQREHELSPGADAQADLEDDQRDVEDDEGDVRVEETRQEGLKQIGRELQGLQPSFSDGVPEPEQAERKKVLLEQLAQLAANDLDRAREELAEDVAEKAEDIEERKEKDLPEPVTAPVKAAEPAIGASEPSELPDETLEEGETPEQAETLAPADAPEGTDEAPADSGPVTSGAESDEK